MKVSVLIAAAGKGERAGLGKNKLFALSGGQTYLEITFNAFKESGLIDEYIVVCSPSEMSYVRTFLPTYAIIAEGGDTRTQSVKKALDLVTGDIVLIHDGARPFVSREVIKNCIDGAEKYGGAIAAVPCRDTVCLAEDNDVTSYVGKSGLFQIQTPQAFRTDLIRNAYSLAGNKTFNDDGEVFLEYAGNLRTVKGDKNNIKLTFPEDFEDRIPCAVRTGVGFDCHRLVEGRKLILGGVEIPHDKGLLGHSDADVLAHAVSDAVLSAAAMRDIGYHFPDTNAQYKGADSILLLKRVLEIIGEKGYKVSSVSATIMAEKPKLNKFIPEITANLAAALGISPDQTGIAATTLEGLGFVGREEGICVHATAVLVSDAEF